MMEEPIVDVKSDKPSVTDVDGDEKWYEASDKQPSLGNLRSTVDYADDDETGPNYVDHFSLRVSSSTVKYRGARVHVYESGNEQFLLEDRSPERGGGDNDEDDDGARRRRRRHTITVKRMPWANFGLLSLRLAYTLVALILVGFLFVLCFQIILFLFLNLPVDSGATSGQKEVKASRMIGTLLSVPVFLYGMASLMAIGSTFVADTWSGGTLVRSVFGWSSTVTELIYFTFFLVIPMLAFIITMMAGYSDPWQICAYVWVVCVGLAFCSFGLGVVYRELTACLELIAIHRDAEFGGAAPNAWKDTLRHAGHAMLLTQIQRLSGTRDERYFVSGDEEEPESGYSMSPDHEPVKIHTRLWTRLTQLGCCSETLKMFDTLDPPFRLYTTEEVRDLLPFITRHNWSLEAMCCRNPEARGITAAKGPSALKPNQVKSSVICNSFGALMITLFIIGLLVWVNAGALFYVIAAIICFLCCLLPMTVSSVSMYKMYREINEEDVEGGCDDEFLDESGVKSSREKKGRTTMFHLLETVRVTQPRPWVCYAGIILEITFLFLWPMGSLFAGRNFPVAGVFLIVGIISFLRKYLDPSVILSELGSLDSVDVEKEPGKEIAQFSVTRQGASNKGAARTLQVKSRLSEIIGHISRSGSVHRWMWFFGVLVLLVFLLFLSASASDDVQPGERPPIVLLNDFYYPPEEGNLAYPTCELTKGFRIPGKGNSALGDFAFLAALAYEMPNVTDVVLDTWFGPGKVVDEAEFVAQYRIDSGTDKNPLYFKLFSFPDVPGAGIVSIRGSQTNWDWLVNMQIWSSAALAQLIKWLIPFGWVWTPILDELVTFVNFIESESLKKVSYYKITSGFINDLFAGYGDSNYDVLRVTGASLGGGMAIITGAQTGAYAVSISGLGAELSRHTFDPPLTLEQINNRVYNFIPDRDIIARIGGRPRLHQEAECIAPTNNLFGCHSMWRSVCEIAFRCGSNGRPVLCRCVRKFGYPEPIQNGTRTFAEACAVEEEAVVAAARGII